MNDDEMVKELRRLRIEITQLEYVDADAETLKKLHRGMQAKIGRLERALELDADEQIDEEEDEEDDDDANICAECEREFPVSVQLQKVETVDGDAWMCPACAPEFMESGATITAACSADCHAGYTGGRALDECGGWMDEAHTLACACACHKSKCIVCNEAEAVEDEHDMCQECANDRKEGGGAN